ncbi:hypothetical protein D0T84_08705 [Dysgonomonas sp. 521]|uniref:hypothetical protein n=1 Tax=Dysgonomonas sp. 521 TaxID=2302932 RepID=UPI0013D2C392|nr:hypothetical protein [Dysgonomonas sp. 521]NDV94995.1 hypothetical protein [Dysgonomonas sp. 521]
MKNKKKIFAVLISLIIIPLAIQAQDITDEYEEFLRQRNQEMIDFQNNRDKEFAAFLKESWELYSAVAGLKREVPGPTVPPRYKEPVTPPPSKQPDKKPVAPPPSKQPDKKPVAPPPGKQPDKEPVTPPPGKQPDKQPVTPPPSKQPDKEPVKPPVPVQRPKGNVDNIDFFGGTYPVSLTERKIHLTDISEQGISDAWTAMAKMDYAPLIKDCLKIKSDLGLNDWGYILLAKAVGERLSKRMDKDEISFVQMFILLQSGYKVKMARMNNHLGMLIACKHVLYNLPYSDINGDRYYIFSNVENESIGSYYTYKKDFTTASHLLDMNVSSQVNLSYAPVAKDIPLTAGKYQVKSVVNKNLMDFYNTFPQCDFDIYYNAKPSSQFNDIILPQFKEMVDGKSRQEAVTILLSFIQHSFPYATDYEQFRYEKTFFVDECFYWPSSDCEDRAILFTYLVKEILDMDAVLLLYPRHLAAAVYFDQDIQGDYVNYKNKKYTICDPTYIGAPIGTCMPEYRNTVPEKIYSY